MRRGRVAEIVLSWLRPGEQSATALTACVTAVRSVPLWASNAARACAACRRGGRPDEDAGKGAREDTAEGAGTAEYTGTAEDAELSAPTRAISFAISSA